MISYAPLWKTMEEKGCTTYTFRKNDEGGVSSSTVRRLKQGQSVSTNTVDMLCTILECDIHDVIEYIPDPE